MFRRAAGLLAAPLLLITACANEADEGAIEVRTGAEAVSALRSAPDAVTDAGTARVELVMEMSFDGHSTELTATGAVDRAAQQMSVEMDMGAVLREAAAADGEELPAGFDGPWEMVADGSTMYVRAPVFELLGASGWLSLDPEDLGTTAEAMGLGAGSFDFTQTLESLRGVVGEPEVVGEEDVRGVPTTHYHASMDLSEALDHAPAAQREELEAAFEQLASSDGLDDADVPVDIWIDEDDLPRRMRMEMDSMFAALGMGDGSMTMTMEWFDFGEAVDITVPSADEVTPMTEALGGLGAGLGS
jgi:hypothetical protein